MLFGFVIAIILRVVLSHEFITSLFSQGMTFTVQELNDLNIAITTGVLFASCTAWYFGSMFFYKLESQVIQTSNDDCLIGNLLLIR